MLNKGESLIETTISIAVFLFTIIPTLNVLNNIYVANKKVDDRIYNKQNSYNILEIIKNMKQNELDEKLCENKKFNNINELLEFLDSKYPLSDKCGEYTLTIRKNDMFSGINSEYHGYNIKINMIEGIYVPKK
ncbi:MAG: hypothetical protein ACTTIS_01440 [Streptobacillus sp.]